MMKSLRIESNCLIHFGGDLFMSPDVRVGRKTSYMLKNLVINNG
jgi:hypothetical protein